MSITRLQQARQMYALGKLVERVGFQGGGRDAGAGSGFGDGPSSSGGDNDRPTMADISGPKTTSSSTKGNDDDYSFTGPRDLGVTTRTTNTIDAPEAKEFIGGVAYDVTPATKDIRERAKVKQAILNPTVKRNKIFDPISNTFINTFAPTQKTMFDRVKQILSIASVLSPHTLVGKIGLGLNTYDKVKTGLQTVSSIADTFGINTDSITNSLSNNFSGKKSNTTTNTNTNNGGDGEGLASLENQASGYDEYILLLQKLQSGNISDSERNRFNVLKNMLGI